MHAFTKCRRFLCDARKWYLNSWGHDSYKPLREENCSVPKKIRCFWFLIYIVFSWVFNHGVRIPELLQHVILKFDKPCLVAIYKSWVFPAFLYYQLSLVFLKIVYTSYATLYAEQLDSSLWISIDLYPISIKRAQTSAVILLTGSNARLRIDLRTWYSFQIHEL